MNEKNIHLKKIIRYRASYSGMKETDLLYKRLILNKLDTLDSTELLLLSNLFNEIPDAEIFNILTNKFKKKNQSNTFKKLIDKIINE